MKKMIKWKKYNINLKSLQEIQIYIKYEWELPTFSIFFDENCSSEEIGRRKEEFCSSTGVKYAKDFVEWSWNLSLDFFESSLKKGWTMDEMTEGSTDSCWLPSWFESICESKLL